jgi:hypothetical protein
MSTFLDDQLGVAQQEESVKADGDGGPESRKPNVENKGQNEKPQDGHADHEEHSSEDVEVNLGCEGINSHCSSNCSSADGSHPDRLLICPRKLIPMGSVSVICKSSSPVNTFLTCEIAEAKSEEE